LGYVFLTAQKYSFPAPIPSRSVALKRSASIGVGEYSRQDGLDCIWFVNEQGMYAQAIDHDFLAKYLEIVEISRERSLYGKNRMPLGASSNADAESPRILRI